MNNEFEYKGYKLGQEFELECPEDYYILIDDPITFKQYKYYVPKLSFVIDSLYVTLSDTCEIGIKFLQIPQSRLGESIVKQDRKLENMYGSETTYGVPMITIKYSYYRFIDLLNEYKKK